MEVFVYLNTIDTFWMEHLNTMDDLRSGIGLRGYAQRDPLIEYKREGFELFEKLVGSIDSEVARRIFRVSAEHRHTPIKIEPVVDLSKASEVHKEALDETQLLEGVGEFIPRVPNPDVIARGGSPVDSRVLETTWQSSSGDTRIKVEGSSNDEKYSTAAQSLEEVEIPVTIEEPVSTGTKVTVERGGQVVSEKVYREDGGMVRKKVGRNDPCYCGSGKKYKKCHLNKV